MLRTPSEALTGPLPGCFGAWTSAVHSVIFVIKWWNSGFYNVLRREFGYRRRRLRVEWAKVSTCEA
jgi:hypothetical protein